MAKLEHNVQMALDESRLLLLGCEVLLGFGLRATFEPGFAALSFEQQCLSLASTMGLVLAIGLLILPGAFHQIVERGHDGERLLRVATRTLAPALLPILFALAVFLYLVAARIEPRAAPWIAGAFSTIGLFFLYGGRAFSRVKRRRIDKSEDPVAATPTHRKVQHVLTEARLVIPGAQALLGFQFSITLMEAFGSLPQSSKLLHLFAIGMVALATVLLCTPAAWHRMVEQGEETEGFHRRASALVIGSLVPLALGLSADVFVVFRHVTGSQDAARIAGAVALASTLGLWFGWTLAFRLRARAT